MKISIALILKFILSDVSNYKPGSSSMNHNKQLNLKALVLNVSAFCFNCIILFRFIDDELGLFETF